MKQKYHSYLDWVAQQKADGEEADSPPGPPVFISLLKAMLQDTDFKKTKGSEEKITAAISSLQDMDEEGLQQAVPLCKVQKAFSKKGESKKNRVRLLLNVEDPIKNQVISYLCSKGGQKKQGMAPQGGGIREMKAMLEFMSGAKEEWDDDE